VPLQQDYVSTIRRVLPSVVEIKTASGLGSGVVYDTAGHIVTNAHVVGTATLFQVLLAGSASPLPARLTGSYPPDDLAVIQVTGAAHLVPARFADSSRSITQSFSQHRRRQTATASSAQRPGR